MMSQWEKVSAAIPDHLSSIPYLPYLLILKGENTSASCPLTSICTL